MLEFWLQFGLATVAAQRAPSRSCAPRTAARCARLLQIQNHGVQQREINNARDTNRDGDFESSGQRCCPVPNPVDHL
jgi:hypothetical protein